jgi:hypothetical protein
MHLTFEKVDKGTFLVIYETHITLQFTAVNRSQEQVMMYESDTDKVICTGGNNTHMLAVSLIKKFSVKIMSYFTTVDSRFIFYSIHKHQRDGCRNL